MSITWRTRHHHQRYVDTRRTSLCAGCGIPVVIARPVDRTNNNAGKAGVVVSGPIISWMRTGVRVVLRQLGDLVVGLQFSPLSFTACTISFWRRVVLSASSGWSFFDINLSVLLDFTHSCCVLRVSDPCWKTRRLGQVRLLHGGLLLHGAAATLQRWGCPGYRLLGRGCGGMVADSSRARGLCPFILVRPCQIPLQYGRCTSTTPVPVRSDRLTPQVH